MTTTRNSTPTQKSDPIWATAFFKNYFTFTTTHDLSRKNRHTQVKEAVDDLQRQCRLLGKIDRAYQTQLARTVLAQVLNLNKGK